MLKKLVLVTGATGKQGGSLLSSLLGSRSYEIRALTRNVTSDAAQALSAKGIQVVQGDLGDKESLMTACKGAYAVFGVSIPEFAGGSDEFTQGRNLVDACKTNHVDVLVWSSLPSCKETSGGKYTVIPFDAKAEVEKYIKSADQPAIVFRTGGFSSNMILHGALQRDPASPSAYNLYIPFVEASVPQPYTYVEKDVGPVVLAAIDKWADPAWRAELSKAPIPLVSYRMNGTEITTIFSKVTGKELKWVTVLQETGPRPLISMYKWAREGLWGYGDTIPVDIIGRMGVEMHTLEDYLQDAVIPWMNAQE